MGTGSLPGSAGTTATVVLADAPGHAAALVTCIKEGSA